MKRVTGLGGVFFKTSDPKKIQAWYEKHLGMTMTDYGHSFKWKELDKPEASALTQWTPFKDDTTYFGPSEKPFMINYRVENLVDLLKVLKEEGVTVVCEIQEYSYGKFGWIMDPDGNKIELWEPMDDGS